MLLWIGIAVCVILFLLGSPIFIALAAGGAFILTWHIGVPIETTIQLCYNGIDKWVLLAIPFFILAGNLMLYGGAAKRLVDFLDSLLGHFPGGLALVTAWAAAFFAALTGSSLSVASAVGTITIPAMDERGYGRGYSTGLLAVCATLGNLIPPSVYLIVLGSVVNVSVGKLFMAGILPGILIVIFISVPVVIIAKKKRYGLKAPTTWRWRGKSFVIAIPALLTPVIILGGIYGGIFTPTEAAAVGCAWAVIAGLVYREMKGSSIWKATDATLRLTARILILIGAAVLLGVVFTYAGIPQAITGLVTRAHLSPLAFIWLSGLLLLGLGCIMDALPIIYVVAPLLWPTVMALNINPIHFLILATICLLIGQVTPPIGMVLYETSAIANEPSENVIRGSIPFLIAMVCGLIVVSVWPGICLFLPSLMK